MSDTAAAAPQLEVPAESQPNFSPAERAEIVARINERTKNHPILCPVCGQVGSYVLGDGFTFLVVQYTNQQVKLAGDGMPCLALTCRVCGNTLLINLLILGLPHLVNRPSRA
jgi:hypothetical protein